MAGFELRPLGAEHLGSLSQMLEGCDSLPFAEFPGADRAALAALEAQALQARTLSGRSSAWVAVDGSTVLGAASVRRLEWDSRHFGFECAHTDALHVPTGSGAGAIARALVDKLLIESGRRGVHFLTARCLAGRPDLVDGLEDAGFRLKDTSVKYLVDVHAAPPMPQGTSCTIRPFVNNDLTALVAIAGSFVANRFHADQRIPAARSDALYEQMLRNAVADSTVEVTVGCREQAPIAFVTHRRRRDLDGPLGGRLVQLLFTAVAPAERRRGVQTAMVARLLESMRDAVDMAEFNTQVHNIGAQRAWIRLGFRPVSARHTFHRWL